MRRICILAFMASMGSVGCDGNLPPVEPVGDDGKADQIDPTGQEHQGGLLLEAPPTTRGQDGGPYIKYRGVGVQPGTRSSFTKGTGCLSLYALMQDCTVSIAADQTTTYRLSSFYPHWDQDAFAVDFGPEWAMSVTRDGKNFMSSIWRAGFDHEMLTLAGVFHIEFAGLGVFPPMDVSVATGVAKDVDLTADKRATIHILPPTSRSFGNSSCSKGNQLVQRNNDSGPVVRSMTLQTRTDESYRVFPLIAADATHYEIWTGDLTAPLTLGVGQTLAFKVKRIDVNNVLIKRGDGSTYYTTGTYVVARKDDTSGSYKPAFGGCVSTTPSGLDVVPGVYKITTSWTTADGPDSEENILDLR